MPSMYLYMLAVLCICTKTSSISASLPVNVNLRVLLGSNGEVQGTTGGTEGLVPSTGGAVDSNSAMEAIQELQRHIEALSSNITLLESIEERLQNVSDLAQATSAVQATILQILGSIERAHGDPCQTNEQCVGEGQECNARTNTCDCIAPSEYQASVDFCLPAGWVSTPTPTYFLRLESSPHKNWNDSLRACEALDSKGRSRLAILKNSERDRAAAGLSNVGMGAGNQIRAWIGGRQLNHTSYLWNDGTALDNVDPEGPLKVDVDGRYFNFNDREQIDGSTTHPYRPLGYDDEFCMLLFLTRNAWGDNLCYHLANYICELDLTL